jgi:hypothetical protein
MASRPFASVGAAKSQLRWRIISTYQRTQRIIAAAASPSADTQAAVAAYDKACEYPRSDVQRASKLFPDINALLTSLLNDIPDDALGSRIASAWPYHQNDEGRKTKRRQSVS